MYITIICAKIFYGSTKLDVDSHISTYRAQGKRKFAVDPYIGANPTMIINKVYVQMTDSQFVRFKNAGRRHPSATPGKKVGTEDRERVDRTSIKKLEKWDVEPYGQLTNKAGPWGNGSLTNRDHMTANSSNQMRNAALPANVSDSHSVVKRSGLAITVSGKHHRKASYTYGGRTKKASPLPGLNRMEYGALHPGAAFLTEMGEMIEWKKNHQNGIGVAKNTLRLEMVGAYAYMYKKAADLSVIDASIAQDSALVQWVQDAVNNDDNCVRK